MPKYTDLTKLSEDQQVEQIGKYAMDEKKVGFVVPDKEETIRRFIQKISSRFPNLIVERVGKLTKGSYTLKAFKKPQN